jgi:hypothetical protein
MWTLAYLRDREEMLPDPLYSWSDVHASGRNGHKAGSCNACDSSRSGKVEQIDEPSGTLFVLVGEANSLPQKGIEHRGYAVMVYTIVGYSPHTGPK